MKKILYSRISPNQISICKTEGFSTEESDLTVHLHINRTSGSFDIRMFHPITTKSTNNFNAIKKAYDISEVVLIDHLLIEAGIMGNRIKKHTQNSSKADGQSKAVKIK